MHQVTTFECVKKVFDTTDHLLIKLYLMAICDKINVICLEFKLGLFQSYSFNQARIIIVMYLAN